MAVVVNNPGAAESDGGMGFFFGAILVIVVILLLLFFGLPLLQQVGQPQNPQINVPSDIDVNLRQPGQ